MKTTPRKTAKGSIRSVEIAIAAWVDLLGYGAQLELVGFDPLSDGADLALNRLERFHDVVAQHACRYFNTFVMNDGMVAYRDLSPRTPEVTLDFLVRALDLHKEINCIDINELGHPGARMVIAVGFRVRRKVDHNSLLHEGKGKAIKERLKEGTISVEYAINEALKTRPHKDVTPELQGNFAFTKAYLADNSGSAAGLGGPNCFVDLAMFHAESLDWLQFSNVVDWSARGLSARFGQVSTFEKSSSRHDQVLDAFEIASVLSEDPNIINKIRATKVRPTRTKQ